MSASESTTTRRFSSPAQFELPSFLRTRGARLTMIVVGILLAYALPIIRPPVLTTTGSDFGGVLVEAASYALVAVGLNT
jgi:branched-chain amino acid transport system permease protein